MSVSDDRTSGCSIPITEYEDTSCGTSNSNNNNNNNNNTSSIEFDAVEHPLELGEPNSGIEEGGDDDDDNDNEEEEVGDNNSEEEGEGEYRFQFKESMDPLSFAEEDASGLQPYERFEQIIQHDYEALASKKRRPPLQQCSTELPPPAKKARHQEEENVDASFEELMETMCGGRRKSRKARRRGRKRGSKNKANPEVTAKLGIAQIDYALGRYKEAISMLKEVIRLAPNLSDPYHALALVYTAMDDQKKALSFYLIAAHLSARDSPLWKLLFSLSIEQGHKGQANFCLNKALTANPEDIDLWFDRASLYAERGEHQKVAESYEQISRLEPDNIEVLRNATQLYKKCGQHERAVSILEDRLKNHSDDANLSVVDLLASELMEINAYAKALEHLEHTKKVYTGKEIPLSLIVKAGICHVHLGHLEQAEAYFVYLQRENAATDPDLIINVADSLMIVGQYESALVYYMMLEEDANKNNGYLHLKIARCYDSLKKRAQAIEYYYKGIEKFDRSVDARLRLSSLLLEEHRDGEAISVLSAPPESESVTDTRSDTSNSWWRSGKIKLKLAEIYKAKGSFEAFADVLFPVIHDTLLEPVPQKDKSRKRLSRSVLEERAKVLNDDQSGNLFQGYRPVASPAELSKASRAKRLIEKRAAALDAEIGGKSDDSDNESPQVFREPPLPDLLKDEGHHHLIVDLCKSLASVQRYWDALKIISLSLKLASNILSDQMKEDLRTLGAQIEYKIDDPAQGRACGRYLVSHNPYSFSAWNCYYRGILRNNRISKHNKFLHSMRVKHKDSVPPIIISAHQFTMISRHQAAAREYLEAHKLMPDNPLINLCVGASLINLSIGDRLQNKHQTILQGLAFLYNNSQLCEDSQEALYNIARAYHHVGLVSLATKYYEKVLAIREKDYPIPVVPHENPDLMDSKRSGYCDLRREAAYNLHLIYKESGALDLARQVLKDHVVT